MNKKLNVKGFCTDLAYDLVGSVLYAAGIVCFVNPANMAPGGMSGVAILLNYLWGLPIGTMTIVLNIPLFMADQADRLIGLALEQGNAQ